MPYSFTTSLKFWIDKVGVFCMCAKSISTFLLKLAITVYMCGYSTEQYSLKVPSQIPILLTDKILEDSCKYFDLEDLEGSLHISCNNIDKDPC